MLFEMRRADSKALIGKENNFDIRGGVISPLMPTSVSGDTIALVMRLRKDTEVRVL